MIAPLERVLTNVFGHNSVSIQQVDAEDALQRVGRQPFDMLLVDLTDLGEEGVQTLGFLRSCSPQTPMIAIVGTGEEAIAIEALRAGVHECISSDDLSGVGLPRAIRYAIERNASQGRLDDAREQLSRNQEMRGLDAMGGPSPLTITQRSLGARDLRELSASDFAEMVEAYGGLLERVPLGRLPREQGQWSDALSAIADRMGMLRAGPRDVIDLHKAAMAQRLDTATSGESKAYVEEGRLLLLQLMGYLVSFYRSLSWSRGPIVRRGHDADGGMRGRSDAQGKSTR